MISAQGGRTVGNGAGRPNGKVNRPLFLVKHHCVVRIAHLVCWDCYRYTDKIT